MSVGGAVIVGAGECGTRAALALREAGYPGPVTLIGEEAGLPYERPPLSKPDGEVVPRRPVCGSERFATADIDYLAGQRVVALDPGDKTVSLAGGATLTYDRLLLATGAAPRGLSCPGGERAHTFRTFNDARRVHAAAGPGSRVVIVGAGLIGMELAACLRSRGAEVTVIEAADRPLGRAVPAALAERLLGRHLEAGVRFIFNAAVDNVNEHAVVLGDGASVPADIVVAAIGVLPNTALAAAAGLAVGDGILVDARLRTGSPHIFAAGDCACLDTGEGCRLRYETWRNAQAQGELAARNMAGAGEAFATRPWFWSEQYELGLQVVGLFSERHSVATRSLPDGARTLFFANGDGTLAAAAGLGTGDTVARDIRIARMLIEAGAKPDRDALCDPSVNLKALLKRARAA